jgi:hypothetical protein
MHYANPFKGKPESSFDFYAYTYCSPYFHQDFKLFAPVPYKNMDILVSYEINKQALRSFPLHEVLYGKLWPGKKEIYLLSEFIFTDLLIIWYAYAYLCKVLIKIQTRSDPESREGKSFAT